MTQDEGEQIQFRNLTRADAGRKGGIARATNRKQRIAALQECRAVLETVCDTPAKRLQIPILLSDYRVILEAQIKHRSGRRVARGWQPISAKRLHNVKSRFMAGLWRLGAIARASKPETERYERREDAPTQAAWLREIRQRQWESGLI